jgi:hypothetical protein
MSDLNVDLNGIAEQLNSAVSAGDSGNPSPAPSTPSATPDSQTPPASVSSATDSTPNDDVIEVPFPDGTKETIKRSELPNYLMRQRDYTKKTQEIAKFRQQYEAFEQNAPLIREQLEFAQQMRELTANPQALLSHLVQTLGPQEAFKAFSGLVQQQQEYDPNDIPTYQEADQLIDKRMNTRLSEMEKRYQELEQKFQQSLEQGVDSKIQKLEFERQKNEYANKFDTLVSKSFSENPQLQAIDLVEDVMRFKVASKIENYVRLNGAEPTFEQAATWWNDAVKEQVTKLETQFAAKRANSPLNNSIEPAGGNRPVNVNTERKRYYDKASGRFDEDGLLKDLTARLSNLDRL